MNILLCIDDYKWDYTRHCAVTILSVLETNKKNKIKFYIMSSWLTKDNINELKRIVHSYNQEIEFIIDDGIIPKEIKETVIVRRNLTRWTWYRLFFPLFIKNIDRLLYIDCDVLVNKDIKGIYDMNMKWKTIVWYLEPEPSRYLKKQYFWISNYINAWVILIDAKKYDINKINDDNIRIINEKYGERINDCDQDYLNIIFRDEIWIYNKGMNYVIERPFYNKWIDDASIIHCLTKPYIQNSNAPKKICDLYNYYLEKTKWKWFPIEKRAIPYVWYLHNIMYWAVFLFLKKFFGLKVASKYSIFHQNLWKNMLKLLRMLKK